MRWDCRTVHCLRSHLRGRPKIRSPDQMTYKATTMLSKFCGSKTTSLSSRITRTQQQAKRSPSTATKSIQSCEARKTTTKLASFACLLTQHRLLATHPEEGVDMRPGSRRGPLPNILSLSQIRQARMSGFLDLLQMKRARRLGGCTSSRKRVGQRCHSHPSTGAPTLRPLVWSST